MTKTLSSILVMLFVSSFAHADNYCLAIRGNGELAPAHWGGMSRIVETLGLPQKQAGGSSASISMFLLDSIATNSLVQEAKDEDQKLVASLLIKSLQGYLIYLSQTQEFKDVQLLFQQSQTLASSGVNKDLTAVLAALSSGSLSASALKAKALAEKALKIGILNEELYGKVIESANIIQTNTPGPSTVLHAKRIQFIFAELQKTISVFGKFDAATDTNLFFRPGIISFSGLGQQLGRIANFYSQNKSRPESRKQMGLFINSCKEDSRGLTWLELFAKRPDCQAQFMAAINAYFFQEEKGLNFATNDIGQTIQSFPTTSVLVGSAYKQAKKAIDGYAGAMSATYGDSFKIDNPRDVRFGYWGQFDSGFKSRLPKDDAKSSKFYSLGMTDWQTVLSLSPAEPGLSPLLEFKTKKTNKIISAGGWSDLHPVVVLKATGCENVVYLNRRGGESLFAQGVAKRLLNFDRDWQVLKTQPSVGTSDPEDIGAINGVLNNQGDKSDMTSLWSRLYNVANTDSSYNRALEEVDAVLCTDWNDYNTFQKEGIPLMIDNAYKSSFYVSPSSELSVRSDLNPRIDISEENEKGFPKNVGCYPRK